jgi:hypothetical protein
MVFNNVRFNRDAAEQIITSGRNGMRCPSLTRLLVSVRVTGKITFVRPDLCRPGNPGYAGATESRGSHALLALA